MTSTSTPRRGSSRALLALLAASLISGRAVAEGQYHVLLKGETLYSVAKQYGLTADVIARANSIEDPSRLKAGTKLLIPEPLVEPKASPAGAAQGSAQGGAAPTVHKVVKGDTLFSIARAYGVEVSELRAANKLGSSSMIKPGDNLKIPGVPPAGAAPAGTAAAPAASSAAGSPAGASAGAAATPPSSRAGSPSPSDRGNEGAAGGKAKAGDPAVPEAVKTSAKAVRRDIAWPCPGEILYLEGKAYGVIIKAKLGETQRAVASGTVSSAGPYRGYGNVVFVLSRTGHIYVYGGNDRISVRAGDRVASGQELGRVGMDLKQGGPTAYFLVFKNGEAVDPAIAPRD